MDKNTAKSVKLNKGEVCVYDFGEVKLYAYKTNDFIDNEVFIITKNSKGIVIELPCFYDNIKELTEYLAKENIDVVAKLVAYHGAGASFLPDVPAYGTASSVAYNSNGGGAALVANFKTTFGDISDASICNADNILDDGDFEIAGIKLVITSNSEAFDVEIPEINCVYTHMLGHDCHSIVAGCSHADGIIEKLNYYISKDFNLVLTSHYTPENLKDVKTKIDYLKDLKNIADACTNAEEMKKAVSEKYPEYSGMNYLDMTVGFFFPTKS